MASYERTTYNPAATATNGFNSYAPQSERAVESDNTSFGERGDVTSNASSGSFPADSSSYPNSMMGSGARSDRPQPSGAPDASYPGTATSTSDARNYGDNPRATVGGEETGQYGGRVSDNADQSMIGTEREQPTEGEQSYAAGLKDTAGRVVGSAMNAAGMGTKTNDRNGDYRD